jgi:hypothetical protein
MPFDGKPDAITAKLQDGNTGGASVRSITLWVIDGLIAHYGLPHPEPITPVRPDLRADLRSIRAQLGIRGDNARECIIRGANGHGFAIRSFNGIRYLANSMGTLHSVLLRARDYARGEPMRRPVVSFPPDRPPNFRPFRTPLPAVPGCTGGRERFLQRKQNSDVVVGVSYSQSYLARLNPPTNCAPPQRASVVGTSPRRDLFSYRERCCIPARAEFLARTCEVIPTLQVSRAVCGFHANDTGTLYIYDHGDPTAYFHCHGCGARGAAEHMPGGSYRLTRRAADEALPA